MAYVMVASRCLIVLVFAISAFAKLRSRARYREFRAWLAGLGIPVVRARPNPVAAVMASAEVAVAVLVALPWTERGGLAAAAAVLALFAAGTLLALRQGARVPCQCFGASASPLRLRHVLRDLLLSAAAVAGASASNHGMQPAGTLVALVTGCVMALCTVFLDDLAALLTDGTQAGPADASGEHQ